MGFNLKFVSGKRAGEIVALGPGEATVGRAPGNTILIPAQDDLYASSNHARLVLEAGQWYVEDLGSTNGTFVGGRQITERTALKVGDRVSLGRNGPAFELQLEVPKTVLEPARTMLEEKRAETRPTSPPTAPQPISRAASDPHRPVGAKTVMQMIDAANRSAKSSRGNRFGRTTVFMQEIVRMAVSESSKRMRRTVAVLAAVIVALVGLQVWQTIHSRRQTEAIKKDLVAQYEKGLEGLEAQLAAERSEMEGKKAALDQLSDQLRARVKQLVAERAERSTALDSLRGDLEASNARATELARQIGALQATALQTQKQLATQPDIAADLDATRSELEVALRDLDAERSRNQELRQQFNDTLQQDAAMPSEQKAELQQIDSEMAAAQEKTEQFEAALGELEARIAESRRDRGSKVETFKAELQSAPQDAVLSAMTDLEQQARPGGGPRSGTSLVPASVASRSQPAESTPGMNTSAIPARSTSTHAALRISTPQPLAQLKKRLAIGRFECLVSNIPWQASKADVERQLASQMTTLLNETGRFLVVERSDLDQILLEQQLAQTGIFTEETATKAGGLLGAQALVIGKVTQLDRNVEAKKSSTNWGALFNAFSSIAGGSGGSDYNQYTSNIDLTTTTANVASTFTIHIDLKVVDTTTGEVLFTTAAHGQATDQRKSTAMGTQAVSAEVLLQGNDDISSATRQALFDATVKIVEGMEAQPWRGRVMALDQGQVIVNAGTDFSLRPGDTFRAMRRGKALTDPETGQSRGFLEKSAGIIRVDRVESDKSFAEVVERSLDLSVGDTLVYLGSTRILGEGESDDPGAIDPSRLPPVRYALLKGKRPFAYAGPGTAFGQIELKDLSEGSPVWVRLTLGDWIKVQLPQGNYVWMHAPSLLMKEEPPTHIAAVRVSAKRIKVYTVPCPKSSALEKAKMGEQLSVVEKLGAWYKVATKRGRNGWVQASEVASVDEAS